MVIKHNIAAMNAQRQYGITGKKKAKHTKKLSSGYHINRAADDAAGLSISEKMRRQIRGLLQGVENTQDGVSLCQVADGALNEVHDMIHRLEELSVQAANGTNSQSDREMIQQEVGQLLTEINRISDTTTFNEQNLFGGTSAGETVGNSAQRGKKAAVQNMTKAANVMVKTAVYAAQNSANVPKLMTYGVSAPYAAGTACGDFTISGGMLGTDYTFSGGVLTIISSAAITIQNTNPAAATTNRIEVAKDVSANITLAGVNIDVSRQNSTAAFKIADNSSGNATVMLADSSNNILKSGNGCAGLQKNGATGTLTIKGAGSLAATGGNQGAGIGGGNNGAGCGIIINGGNVTATGGGTWQGGGAGIGGGNGGEGNDITISGGCVTARGGEGISGSSGNPGGGAGIGGGNGKSGNRITISGGEVSAAGGIRGAAIGGGKHNSGNYITISGGKVTANSGGEAAGIGGGYRSSGNYITISGGEVTAKGIAAGIGGGHRGAGTNITISGGKVTATSSYGGQNIGGGRNSAGYNVIVGGSPYSPSGRDSTAVIVAGPDGSLIIDGTKGSVKGEVALDKDLDISNNVTLTINGSAELTVGDGVTLTNNGTVIVDGVLTNNGTIVNNGTIINKNKVTNNDTLDNDGRLTNQTGGDITNSGTVDNGGTINNDGTFTNSGPGQVTGSGGINGNQPISKPTPPTSPDQPGGSTGTNGAKRWWIQCGCDAGVGMFVEIDVMNTNLLGLSGLNVTTKQSAGDAMDAVSGALAYVSAMRSKIGAQQNRLEHTIANESNIVENTTVAESCIRDADMAAEMVGLSIANILAQTGRAVLAQANTGSEGVLALLQ